MSVIKNEIIRFLLVGILNTFVGYIIFALTYFLVSDRILALFTAYTLGILFNYETYSKYVFKRSNKKVFINFLLIYIGLFMLNNFLLYCLENTFKINLYFSQFYAIIIVTPILYILNKKYVFIDPMEKE